MRESTYFQLIFGWNLLLVAVSQLDLDPQWREDCPQLVLKVLEGYVPRGNESAGVFKKNPDINDFNTCTALCCEQPSCNVVFMFKQTCFQVKRSTLLLTYF